MYTKYIPQARKKRKKRKAVHDGKIDGRRRAKIKFTLDHDRQVFRYAVKRGLIVRGGNLALSSMTIGESVPRVSPR